MSTLGVFEGVRVETKECGGEGGREGCITREVGGGATATICSCKEDKCNIWVGGGSEMKTVGLADFMWAIAGVFV